MDITFTNIKEAKGKMFVAVYDSEASYLNVEKAVIKEFVAVDKTGSLTIKLNLEKEGRYAVAAFHDLNGNGKIDKNLLGVPTEPYAFSNNVRPSFRAPNWNESSFKWKPGSTPVTLKLETW
jgi:uncharacterized protein (DUF2141 family)